MASLTPVYDSLVFLRQHVVATALTALAARIISVLMYRLYFHPLAKIPGPRLAAATWLYEIYFDLYLGGRFVFEIGRLHDIYGPIVRITPDEVHVNNPALVDVVYPGGGTKVDKDPYLARQFGLPNSGLTTVDHDLHRIRRSALNRYFSKGAVLKFESFVHEMSQKLCNRLEDHANKGPVRISTAYSSFTTDVITEYCFGRNYNFLDRQHFVPNLQAANDALGELLPYLKAAPWLHKIMRLIPPSLLLKMDPGMASWIKVEHDCREEVVEARKRIKAGPSSKKYSTVIDELLQGPLPEEEKKDGRLFIEGVVLINAASETTAWTLSVCTFYLLHQPPTLAKLRKELDTVLTDSSQIPALSVLEQLPYLNGTISETLRHAFGVVSRLPRIHTKDSVRLHSEGGLLSKPTQGAGREYVVPPGYPISMTSVHVHMNPTLFPDPLAFAPERWLDSEGKRRKDLDKYILAFSKGSRGCLGINLAYAELFICIATVVARLADRMELFETTVDDVLLHHDCFTMRPQPESKGIRVFIK